MISTTFNFLMCLPAKEECVWGYNWAAKASGPLLAFGSPQSLIAAPPGASMWSQARCWHFWHPVTLKMPGRNSWASYRVNAHDYTGQAWWAQWGNIHILIYMNGTPVITQDPICVSFALALHPGCGENNQMWENHCIWPTGETVHRCISEYCLYILTRSESIRIQSR